MKRKIPGAGVLFLVALLAACDRFPRDATERIQHGLDAVGEGNYGEAYWWWRPLADDGMAEAQHQLGWLYANGNGLRVDLPRAIDWWRKAAAQGHVDAEFAIGMAYLNGHVRSLEPDFQQAIEWLARAAGHASEDAEEIVLRLLATDTDKTLEARPSLLAEAWLGEPLRVGTDDADCLSGKSGKSKSLARLSAGSKLRQVSESGSWRQVITPDSSGLCWVRKDSLAVEEAATP